MYYVIWSGKDDISPTILSDSEFKIGAFNKNLEIRIFPDFGSAVYFKALLDEIW